MKTNNLVAFEGLFAIPYTVVNLTTPIANYAGIESIYHFTFNIKAT
ncbi:MAG TPA: hypothetical protein PKX91_05550 [Clostridia bacterium]|nr:hypothetical protein [Clostridia bacterium]